MRSFNYNSHELCQWPTIIFSRGSLLPQNVCTCILIGLSVWHPMAITLANQMLAHSESGLNPPFTFPPSPTIKSPLRNSDALSWAPSFFIPPTCTYTSSILWLSPLHSPSPLTSLNNQSLLLHLPHPSPFAPHPSPLVEDRLWQNNSEQSSEHIFRKSPHPLITSNSYMYM